MSAAPSRDTSVKFAALDDLYPDRWALLLTPLAEPSLNVHRERGEEETFKQSGKRPVRTGWNKEARARWVAGIGRAEHLAEMAAHLDRGGNVGLAVPPGVVVLDADTPAAMAWLDAALPAAPMQETARGGHFVARVPSGSDIDATVAVEIVDGISVDVRAAGRSQIVVEPSLHASGTRYAWKRPLPKNTDQLPTCPPLILEAIKKKPKAERPAKASGGRIAEKTRNDTLYRMGCAMRAKGDSEAEIRARLRVRNQERCDPPLSESELDSIAASAAQQEPDADSTSRARASLVTFDSIEERAVEWLWHRRIPSGKITMLDGDPDNMKTTVALDLCARVTTGKAMPFEPASTSRGPAGAIFVSFEDDAADTLLPRFRLAGGDLARMAMLSMRGDDGPRSIEVPGDVVAIEEAVRGFKADLVVIDPLVAAFDANVKTHNDHNVRRALGPLKMLAERTGAAVLCIRHLNKTSGDKAIYRGGGSIGLIGAARAAFIVGLDPNDPDRRLFAPVKNNLSERPTTLAYQPRIVLRDMNDRSSGVATIEWLGTADVTAEEITNAKPEARGAMGEATSIMEEILRDGPMLATEATNQMTARGIATRTITRAKKKLNVRSRRVVTTEGEAYWIWELDK